MKKYFYLTIGLGMVIAGFVIPYVKSPTLPPDYSVGVASALEPFGVFYSGVEYSDEKMSTDRCVDRGLRQVLLQTYTWMFIPGPMIELCVYQDKPEVVKSAGTLD